jgi:hypothetical protein
MTRWAVTRDMMHEDVKLLPSINKEEEINMARDNAIILSSTICNLSRINLKGCILLSRSINEQDPSRSKTSHGCNRNF